MHEGSHAWADACYMGEGEWRMEWRMPHGTWVTARGAWVAWARRRVRRLEVESDAWVKQSAARCEGSTPKAECSVKLFSFIYDPVMLRPFRALLALITCKLRRDVPSSSSLREGAWARRPPRLGPTQPGDEAAPRHRLHPSAPCSKLHHKKGIQDGERLRSGIERSTL